jgi:outer membrane receptor protein involved in Fe transport
MNNRTGCIVLALALTLTGFSVLSADDAEDERKYIEEIIVTGERGATNTLDRAMTVTGFNASLVEKLGIQNAMDLEVLVPGLQVGNRSQGGGKNEDDHFFMRGLGTERSVNHFNDTAVAVYIDGVWTDQTYGTEPAGMFDLERVEVARGPQGTTGGKAAIAGSINFHTRKPTDTFDIRAKAEFTDQFTQRYNIAFGGPIADSSFSYRLTASSYTGDGQIENLGVGPDAGKPDQRTFAPQLRFKNDRWDVTARYSKQTDKGTQHASLPLGGWDTTREFLEDAAGNPICPVDANTGEEVCQRNPFFGIGQSPSLANCNNLNPDGTFKTVAGDATTAQLICDPEDLQLKVSFNAPLKMDNFAENTSLEAAFALNDTLDVIYKFGWHEVVQDTLNDGDTTNRQGGGVCPFNHPEVLAGRLVAGERSQFCALDGGGNGTFTDSRVNYVFTSIQTSHEITLISDFDGPFNFTLGATYLKGDEPYVFRDTQLGSGNTGYRFNDTSAECEANIGALFGPASGNNRLVRDVYTDPVAGANSAGTLYGCPGEPALSAYSDTGATTFVPGSGANSAFFSNVDYESIGVYANAEYVINNTWKMFGGLRDNEDTKGSQQCGFVGGFELDGVHYLSALLRDGTLPPFPEKDDIKWGKVTWNVGTEYSPSDNYMVYGRVSTGYRAGGIACFREGPFDQEEMINYEAGIKGVYFDNTLQLEASVYFQDFDKYWIHAVSAGPNARLNAAE